MAEAPLAVSSWQPGDARVVPPADFLRFLCAGMAQVEGINIASYEEAGLEGCRPLVTRVAALVDVAVEILGLVVSYYEAPGMEAVKAPGGKLASEMDRRVASIRCAQDVADLAFVGRMALRARKEQLAVVAGSQDKWDIISVAGSACREVRKSLGAVEVAVCGLEGLPCTTGDYESELTTSREVRRTYVNFCADILGSGEPGPEDLVKRVRVAATSIVKLTGRPVYPAMRVSDRALLRRLHERLMDWLRAAALGDAGAQAGQRLWRDIAGAAEILLGVNNRAELRAHDAAVVADVVSRLEAGAPEVSQADRALLASMAGRDRDLDTLLARGVAVTSAEVLPILRGLAARLDVPAAAGTAPSPSDVDGDVL